MARAVTQQQFTTEQLAARATHLLRCLTREAKLALSRAEAGSCPVVEMNAAVESCKAALEGVREWQQSPERK